MVNRTFLPSEKLVVWRGPSSGRLSCPHSSKDPGSSNIILISTKFIACSLMQFVTNFSTRGSLQRLCCKKPLHVYYSTHDASTKWRPVTGEFPASVIKPLDTRDWSGRKIEQRVLSAIHSQWFWEVVGSYNCPTTQTLEVSRAFSW